MEPPTSPGQRHHARQPPPPFAPHRESFYYHPPPARGQNCPYVQQAVAPVANWQPATYSTPTIQAHSQQLQLLPTDNNPAASNVTKALPPRLAHHQLTLWATKAQLPALAPGRESD